MQEDLRTWLTIPQFAQATGKGLRTIERLITKQQIVTAKDKREEGRKPITVIDPAEVPRIAAQQLRPVVQSANTATRQPAITSPRLESDVVLKAVEALRMPIAQKLSLTEREAAAYLGFPHAEVKRLRICGSIPSFRLTSREWRFRRVDLEAYMQHVIPSHGVAVYQNGSVEEARS